MMCIEQPLGFLWCTKFYFRSDGGWHNGSDAPFVLQGSYAGASHGVEWAHATSAGYRSAGSRSAGSTPNGYGMPDGRLLADGLGSGNSNVTR